MLSEKPSDFYGMKFAPLTQGDRCPDNSAVDNVPQCLVNQLRLIRSTTIVKQRHRLRRARLRRLSSLSLTLSDGSLDRDMLTTSMNEKYHRNLSMPWQLQDVLYLHRGRCRRLYNDASSWRLYVRCVSRCQLTGICRKRGRRILCWWIREDEWETGGYPRCGYGACWSGYDMTARSVRKKRNCASLENENRHSFSALMQMELEFSSYLLLTNSKRRWRVPNGRK